MHRTILIQGCQSSKVHNTILRFNAHQSRMRDLLLLLTSVGNLWSESHRPLWIFLFPTSIVSPWSEYHHQVPHTTCRHQSAMNGLLPRSHMNDMLPLSRINDLLCMISRHSRPHFRNQLLPFPPCRTRNLLPPSPMRGPFQRRTATRGSAAHPTRSRLCALRLHTPSRVRLATRRPRTSAPRLPPATSGHHHLRPLLCVAPSIIPKTPTPPCQQRMLPAPASSTPPIHLAPRTPRTRPLQRTRVLRHASTPPPFEDRYGRRQMPESCDDAKCFARSRSYGMSESWHCSAEYGCESRGADLRAGLFLENPCLSTQQESVCNPCTQNALDRVDGCLARRRQLRKQRFHRR